MTVMKCELIGKSVHLTGVCVMWVLMILEAIGAIVGEIAFAGFVLAVVVAIVVSVRGLLA
jgi:hypothetical protein